MKRRYIVRNFLKALTVLFAVAFFMPTKAFAHCDTMDGPVVKAAQRALATRNVNVVLIWVQKKDEPEIKERFRQTLAVRRLSREARKLADSYFFETLVRVHRAGEGEPYTGIQPAGTDLGPVVPVADKGLQDGSVDALLKLFTTTASPDIQARFRDAITKKSFNENDVEAGREYVKAYVSLLHYLEHLYEERRSASE